MEPVSQNLTSKLLELLRNEMFSVEDASWHTLLALVAGNDVRFVELAQITHDSLILRQAKSPQDKRDLMVDVREDYVVGVTQNVTAAFSPGPR